MPHPGRPRFEVLDAGPTPLGELSLRRRWDPHFQRDAYEVKLDDEYLMSSLFTVAEAELARLALAELREPGPDPGREPGPEERLDVVVGGLGLGYTARAVLDDPRVQRMVVVERLERVIDWHRQGMVPEGTGLLADPRCTVVTGDLFALLDENGPDPAAPHRRYHAVLVDIDHSPAHLLSCDHASFYRPAGLRLLAGHLRRDGVFALWSNEPPDDEFIATLGEVFTRVRAEVVEFPNVLQHRPAANTVYLARFS